MIFWSIMIFLDAFNPKRIYKIISVIFIAGKILSLDTFGQSTGAYRTISSGDFDQAAIWEVYDGSLWLPAVNKPGITSDVYIEFGHVVMLTQNEEIKSLYLNAEAGTGEKLDLNDFELNLYGSLNAYSGSAPGAPNGAWNTIDWIGSSVDSKLVFKGSSRVIISSGSWSGFTTRSRYTVVFDADPGEVLTVQESFKANKFVVKSGKVLQKGTPGVDCATFSFNNDPAIIGAYGDFVIENGAEFESECGEEIILRSASGLVPAALFDLEEGGILTLKANDPEINSSLINLDGTVYYASGSGTQDFLTSTMVGATVPDTYRHIVFEGGAQKIVPSVIHLSGNMLNYGSGTIVDNSTSVVLEGTADQDIFGFAFDFTDLTVDKEAGTVSFDQNVSVKGDFTMAQGELDFSGNQLFLNTSGFGSYTYSDGSWQNLAKLTYYHIPNTLTASNASFPFVDKYEGGIRMLQILGTQSALNSDLSITYHQLEGVDHDPDFLDNDGTPILHQLNSYFSFSDLSTDNSHLILRISAEDLIVDNVDDLRIVGDHQAAEGSHLSGESIGGQIWANREVTLSELDGNDFTIGSFREATVLPVRWLDLSAQAIGMNNVVHWQVNDVSNIVAFRVYRAIGDVDNFEFIGELSYKDFENEAFVYRILDDIPFYSSRTYYQIGIVDKWGKESLSKVIRVNRFLKNSFQFIHPNPYQSGQIKLMIPEKADQTEFELLIRNSQGKEIFIYSGYWSSHSKAQFVDKLKSLEAGIYFISLFSNEELISMKWIKL